MNSYHGLSLPGSAGIALCLITLGGLATGCSSTPSPLPAAAQTSAGLTATLTTTPSPPHTGDDVLVISLTDAATGQPIGDANITATAEALSPRLPGAQNSGRAQGNGLYNVPVVLPVGSGYRVNIQAQRPGHPTATFTFPIDVSH